MTRTVLVAVFLSLVAVGCTDPGKPSRSIALGGADGDSTALLLTCPVSGKPAQDDVAYVYKGRTIHFCSEDCIERFRTDPEKYLGARKASDKPRSRRLYEGSSSK